MAKDKDNSAEYIQRAQAAMNQRQFGDARAYFLRALEARPELPDAHYGLATVCFLQGDVLGAAHHFKEVTRHDPLRAGAFINLGALYNHMDRAEDAIAALRRGIQLDPTRAEGYYNLGLVYRRLEQWDQAIEAYLEAVRVQPDLADAHMNLANIFLDDDRLAQAIEHYQTALRLRPDWAEAKQGLALAEEALAEVDSEHDTNETVVEVTPDSGERPIVDPERQLDPALHGAILAEIHHATAEADALVRTLGEEAVRKIEADLKELSSSLLRTDTPSHQVAKHLQEFDATVERFKLLKQRLEQVHEKIQASGDDLKRK